MSSSKGRVLVIEDDIDIANLLCLHLTDAGYLVTRVADGRLGLNTALAGDHSLVVLDLMLPGIDGFDVCRRIRANGIETPVLMLTSKSEEMDKVLGLELGADDYLTKPFGIREFLARVKALHRRASSTATGEDPKKLHFGELTIDMLKRRASLGGENVELTAKEWELLALFSMHPGRVFSREELLDLVWGYHYDGYSHTVNTHINRLRNKVERDPARPTYILTKRGLGYRFTDPSEAPR